MLVCSLRVWLDENREGVSAYDLHGFEWCLFWEKCGCDFSHLFGLIVFYDMQHNFNEGGVVELYSTLYCFPPCFRSLFLGLQKDRQRVIGWVCSVLLRR